jgi:hypothetical protein
VCAKASTTGGPLTTPCPTRSATSASQLRDFYDHMAGATIGNLTVQTCVGIARLDGCRLQGTVMHSMRLRLVRGPKPSLCCPLVPRR